MITPGRRRRLRREDRRRPGVRAGRVAREADVGRPVRWSETRSENMTGMVHGRAQLQTVTIGGDRDGNVRAYRLDVLQDAGAYPRLGAVLPMLTRMMAPAVYDIEQVECGPACSSPTPRLDRGLPRRRPPRGHRGHRAGDGPVRRRDRHGPRRGAPAQPLLRPDEFPLTTKGGATYDSGDYAKALDKVLDAVGTPTCGPSRPPRRERGDAVQLGIGVSVYVEITGGDAFAEESAAVEVHPDGTATVLTGTSPHGQGHATAWAMLASEQLGIPIEKITVMHGDTDLVPRGGGTDGLAQPADRRRRRAPGGGRAGRAGQAARGRRCWRPNVDDLVVDRGRGASCAARTPPSRWPTSPSASSCASTRPVRLGRADVPVRRARGRRRGRRRVGQGGRRQIVTIDDAGPSSTR